MTRAEQVLRARKYGHAAALRAGLSDEGARAVAGSLGHRVMLGERFDVLSTVAAEIAQERPRDEARKKEAEKQRLKAEHDAKIDEAFPWLRKPKEPR